MKRYENSRVTITQLIDKLLDQPPVQTKNAEKLRQLHDTTTECLEALTNLGINTQDWGTISGMQKQTNYTN